jgi:hypothetical protein
MKRFQRTNFIAAQCRSGEAKINHEHACPDDLCSAPRRKLTENRCPSARDRRVLQRGNVDDRAGAARKTIDRAPGQLLAPPGRAEKCR